MWDAQENEKDVKPKPRCECNKRLMKFISREETRGAIMVTYRCETCLVSQVDIEVKNVRDLKRDLKRLVKRESEDKK